MKVCIVWEFKALYLCTAIGVIKYKYIIKSTVTAIKICIFIIEILVKVIKYPALG